MAMDINQLNEAFGRILGRPPRPDEAAFLIDAANKNNFSAYEIGEILSGSPEAQRSQTQRDLQGFQDVAGQSDQFVLGKAQQNLEAKFRGMGRTASGSAYAAAFADVAGKLAAQRSSQLAEIYNQRASGIASQEVGQSQGLRKLGYDLDAERRQRAYALEDFYRARDLQNDYMNQVRRSRRGQGIGQIAGALGGAGLGYAFGGGAGAQIGSQLGAGVGGGAGGLFY